MSDLWVGFVLGVVTSFVLVMMTIAFCASDTGKKVLDYLGLDDDEAPTPSQEEE